jgi:hypothetical protein
MGKTKALKAFRKFTREASVSLRCLVVTLSVPPSLLLDPGKYALLSFGVGEAGQVGTIDVDYVHVNIVRF